MKSYTDLEQSKKLAKILSHESADMFYKAGNKTQPTFRLHSYGHIISDKDVCAWSLAALFNILPDSTDIIKDKSDSENEKYMCTVGVKDDIISTFGNSPIDACYQMVIKLKENNLI